MHEDRRRGGATIARADSDGQQSVMKVGSRGIVAVAPPDG